MISVTWAHGEACTRFGHSGGREATERVDLEFLNAVSPRPWDGSESGREPVRVVLPDVSSLAVMAEADALGKARRLYITNADIMKCGLTEGCVGCRAIAEGKRAQGHSEGCRARPETELSKSDDGRARLRTACLRGLVTRREELRAQWC